MMKKILALLSLTLLPVAAQANRAIMEMIPASANTVFIDTINARVGIDTTTPHYALDVDSNAAFGKSPLKSIFDYRGDLTCAAGAIVTCPFFVGDGSGLTGVTSSPVGAAGGDLGGTYPNPKVVSATTGAGMTVTYGLTAATGTFTATGNSQYSVTTSSGIHVLAGGVNAAFITGNAGTSSALDHSPVTCSVGQFSRGIAANGDASGCAAGGAGDVTQAGSNTFTGPNVFNTAVSFSSSVVMGNASNGNVANDSTYTQYAKSIDGVSQSSGCLVVFGTNPTSGVGDPIQLTFTSTTTASLNGAVGVLAETCVPGTICKIAIGGVMRVQARTGTVVGSSLETSGVRCQGQGNIASSGRTIGSLITAESGNWAWIKL